MLYAVPCRDLHVGNHFARSPQIAIVDEQRQIKQIVPLVDSDTACNKKEAMDLCTPFLRCEICSRPSHREEDASALVQPRY